MRLPRSRSSDILKLCTGDRLSAVTTSSTWTETTSPGRPPVVHSSARVLRHYPIDKSLEASLIWRVEGKLDR